MKRTNDLPVLLTYAWVRSTYAALRCLSLKGIRTLAADVSPIGMCQQSRYRYRFYRYRDPFGSDKEGFIEDINRIALRNGPLILIPSHDETEILARRRADLLPIITCPVNDYQSIVMANDKARMADFAKANGIAVPPMVSYDSISGLESALAEIEGPFVVKLRKGNSAKGVFYPADKGETVSMVRHLVQNFSLDPDRFPVVQKYVAGSGWGVSCLYWEGKRIAHFTHKRLREKTSTGGTSTFRESRPNSLLEKMAFRILDSLHWHGLAMVEFKYDSSSGEGWFIEVNPRMWGSIGLAISAGVEFPYLLYLCATEGPHLAEQVFNSSKLKFPWRARWYLGDIIYAVGLRGKAGRLPEIGSLLLPGGANIMDDLYLDDPGAFIGEMGNYLYRFLKYRSTNPVEKGMLG